MAAFSDLPLELLPLIVTHVLKASQLARISLVSKSFYRFTAPVLYDRIIIRHWYQNVKGKVIGVFRTLAQRPELALHVRTLEIGDFPKGLTASESDALVNSCIQGLHNVKHLRSVTWTRDGSLTSEILYALQHNEELSEISINGNHAGHYDPSLLLGLTRLRSISVIMPSAQMVDILPRWMKALGGNLRSLTLICKETTWIHDPLLRDIAPHLPRIEKLSFVGCKKVTHEGIWAVIKQNLHGITALGLEGLTSAFDIVDLSTICRRAGGLTSLRSFTLTFHPNLLSDPWINGVDELLAHSPLELFQAYATETVMENPMTGVLASRLILSHGHRLTKFSIHRIRLQLHTVKEVCSNCPYLRQLFVMVDPSDLMSLGPILACAQRLHAVHVNLSALPQPYDPHARALALVSQCSTSIVQFGVNTRVWQVVREVEADETGEVITRPALSPYENPDVPEQFLVVRA